MGNGSARGGGGRSQRGIPSSATHPGCDLCMLEPCHHKRHHASDISPNSTVPPRVTALEDSRGMSYDVAAYLPGVAWKAATAFTLAFCRHLQGRIAK
jgi:hypothetical protein